MGSTMPSSQNAVTAVANPLARALDQNEAIQESVAQSAEELCVVAAVLSREIPDEVKTGEVAQAIQRTEELENRMQASADDLARVNQSLKDEVSTRTGLERQLAAAQAELGQAHSQAAAHGPAQRLAGSGPAAR